MFAERRTFLIRPLDFTSGAPAGNTAVAYTAGFAFDATTPNSVFSSSLNVITNSTGGLSFTISGGNINGFEIIPEASTMSLLSGGMVLLATRRKRC